MDESCSRKTVHHGNSIVVETSKSNIVVQQKSRAAAESEGLRVLQTRSNASSEAVQQWNRAQRSPGRAAD